MNKVLVIEDDEPCRINILELLEAEEFDVVGAADGRAGLHLARTCLPDLVICDILMRELDGYGVLSELRQDPLTATIPFIFLTASADQRDLRRGMDLGADGYLTKPFTRAELLEIVTTQLERQTVARALIAHDKTDSSHAWASKEAPTASGKEK
jgi:DNA-binding response OmpR family regulator